MSLLIVKYTIKCKQLKLFKQNINIMATPYGKIIVVKTNKLYKIKI